MRVGSRACCRQIALFSAIGGQYSVWEPNPRTSLLTSRLQLSVGAGVILSFKVSNNFRYTTTGYIAYDKACDLNNNWKKNHRV